MAVGSSVFLISLILGQFEAPPKNAPSEADLIAIRDKSGVLNDRLGKLQNEKVPTHLMADIAICAKAADWIVRHQEYFDPASSKWTIEALEKGIERANQLQEGNPSWIARPGSTVLAYQSKVDESIQPYAVVLPRDYQPNENRQWPLHVELHGRNASLNEVSFLHQNDNKPLKEDIPWIQLNIFGRTNNAYRWAGETDVFEALADVKKRFRIDERRITLRGFSMGGAGAWHLGLHHPSIWSSVGAGAGFVETMHHLSRKEPLSPLHQRTTKIYDAQDYALNAFDVPIIGYGGELDPQLFAAKTMHAKGEELGVPIPILIGPQTAHKFHPESLKQFMAFLDEHSKSGRPEFPNPTKIKFITHTPKYNECAWLTVEEQERPFDASVVEANVDSAAKTVSIQTKNIAVLKIQRNVADRAIIDGGTPISLTNPAAGKLASAYFAKGQTGWQELDLEQSKKHETNDFDFADLRKHRNLQGPIDDAFMEPFVCVRPTGAPWSQALNDWSRWTLERFSNEFDHRLRGRVPTVEDHQLTDDQIQSKHLILFGDPGSNSVLAKVIDRLPIKWTRDQIEFNGQSYSTSNHAVALIFPNPLNPRKYVVINSGHTFHESEFQKSNANLYPYLGDFGVIQFEPHSTSGYQESILSSDLFDAHWRFEKASTP